MNKQTGFTLIEMLIVSALSILLAIAVLQAFIVMKRLFMLQQAMVRLQENGRMISVLLGDAIFTAGNMGCNGLHENFPLTMHGISASPYGLFAGERIMGVSWEQLRNNPLIKKEVLSRAHPASDLLWVKTVIDTYPVENISPSQIIAKGRIEWRAKDHTVVVLSDCAQADFLPLQNDTQAKKGFSVVPVKWDPFPYGRSQYSQNAQVSLLSSTIFYIGKAEHVNAQNKPVWALYASDLNAPRAYQLVEGVEFIEFRYGIFEKKRMVFYESNNVRDWSAVRKVRANILLNSIDDGLLAPQPYVIKGITYYPDDRLMRMWWQYEWSVKAIS